MLSALSLCDAHLVSLLSKTIGPFIGLGTRIMILMMMVVMMIMVMTIIKLHGSQVKPGGSLSLLPRLGGLGFFWFFFGEVRCQSMETARMTLSSRPWQPRRRPLSALLVIMCAMALCRRLMQSLEGLLLLGQSTMSLDRRRRMQVESGSMRMTRLLPQLTLTMTHSRSADGRTWMEPGLLAPTGLMAASPAPARPQTPPRPPTRMQQRAEPIEALSMPMTASVMMWKGVRTAATHGVPPASFWRPTVWHMQENTFWHSIASSCLLLRSSPVGSRAAALAACAGAWPTNDGKLCKLKRAGCSRESSWSNGATMNFAAPTSTARATGPRRGGTSCVRNAEQPAHCSVAQRGRSPTRPSCRAGGGPIDSLEPVGKHRGQGGHVLLGGNMVQRTRKRTRGLTAPKVQWDPGDDQPTSAEGGVDRPGRLADERAWGGWTFDTRSSQIDFVVTRRRISTWPSCRAPSATAAKRCRRQLLPSRPSRDQMPESAFGTNGVSWQPSPHRHCRGGGQQGGPARLQGSSSLLGGAAPGVRIGPGTCPGRGSGYDPASESACGAPPAIAVDDMLRGAAVNRFGQQAVAGLCLYQCLLLAACRWTIQCALDRHRARLEHVVAERLEILLKQEVAL
eukprot:s2769_g7.t1